MSAIKGKPVPCRQVITDEEIKHYVPLLGVEETARKFGIGARALKFRKRAIQQREGVLIHPPTRGGHVQQLNRHPASIDLGIQHGHVHVGSDAHYWPGVVPTAHNALLEFIREFKPKVVVMNGDVADFPSISRHAPIAWEHRPSVADEIENLKAMLSEIEKTAIQARRIWTLGNHDGRFETRLATIAPEYAKVHGVHLKDNFPNWEPCWAALINKDVVIKHRFKAGIHAPHNNTMWAGRTIVTGHLHSMKVSPLSDYNGTRWGVDCGCIADPYGAQFYNYTELNPLNWRSGFCLLTFVNGRLLWPELVWMSGPNEVQFRGKVWNL